MEPNTAGESSAIEKETRLYDARQTDREKDRVREAISQSAVFDVPYVVMNFLATIICCYGLFSNSPAVVIGTMIIAMLLGPIVGVALSLVDLDNSLLAKAIVAEIGGVVVVLVTAFILGRIHVDIPITQEIMSRTAPDLLDLMIALGGGAAGAYAMISPRLSVALLVWQSLQPSYHLWHPAASCWREETTNWQAGHSYSPSQTSLLSRLRLPL